MAGDRRAYRVVLTRAGRGLVEQVLPEYYRVADEVWDGFPPVRARQLAADLERLSGNAQKVIQPKDGV